MTPFTDSLTKGVHKHTFSTSLTHVHGLTDFLSFGGIEHIRQQENGTTTNGGEDRTGGELDSHTTYLY